MSIFERFHPRLQDAIVARLGWMSLRPVQDLAGEALLDGKNAVVLAPTAGGKTEASIFPTLSNLMTEEARGLSAIYVAPIKALLNNQAERLGLYTEMVGLRRHVRHGDTPQGARQAFLRDPTELLLTTPESLEVLLMSPKVDSRTLFRRVRTVIIDEVHALAGTDRGAHLMSVLERIAGFSDHDVQRVGLSATVGNPDAILAWLRGSSTRDGVVVDPPAPPARRELLVTHRDFMPDLARDASRLARGQKSLFFCQSRATTEAVAEQMRRSGTEVFVHHSSVSREEREEAEERFHRGRDACIVCTSTLELGIDVGDLDRVLQAEAPETVSSFMQRMGRTGRRAGQSANTTFFCTNGDSVLLATALIELAKTGWVEDVPVLDRCWPVLVHQLFALALAHDGIPPDEAWATLSRVPDFAGITRAEFDRLLAFMLRDRSLEMASGRLLLGPKAERRFGRKNFMELYSVFSSPQTYTVVTMNGRPLGSLQQDFVDRLVDGASSFLLGGRGWSVVHVSHGDRRVKVVPSGRGAQPTWGGYLPQFLGFGVAKQVLELLTREDEPGYLHASALVALREQRSAFDGVLDAELGGLEITSEEANWWTFAGGRINSTLKHALNSLGHDWKVVSDNYAVRIRAKDLNDHAVQEALDELAEPEFWENAALWGEIATELPNYRLTKFQDVLPPWVQREMVATFLLDIEGAWRWLGGQDTSGAAGVLREALAQVPAGVSPLPMDTPTIEYAKPLNPARWVGTSAELREAVDCLMECGLVGLDVETTLNDRALCLVQLATHRETFLIDALAIPDLAPLGALLASEDVVKVIHNAKFERDVLGQLGYLVENVVDTLEVSRRQRGKDADGGHSLAAVCAREFGIELDKREQCSNWRRRPLTEEQVAYAALDAEVLIRLAAERQDPETK
jgi:ATP-dependent helicase Lhr and Lhr-like helicase